MSRWKIYTPDGVQDILTEDCYLKRSLEQRYRDLFRSCGYYEIETPTIEFYDVFASEHGAMPQENMFKFFDQQGRILVLRPDITIPVARITATKYRDAAYPLRFSYIGNVFRYNDWGGGKQNEFTQAGIEVLGADTPESDAEVIAIAIKALKASGLEDFQVDIGQADFFNGLMEEAGLPEEETGKVRTLIERKDYAGLEEFFESGGIRPESLGAGPEGRKAGTERNGTNPAGRKIGSEGSRTKPEGSKTRSERSGIRPELKKLICGLPGFFGSAELIDRVMALNLNARAREALENIRRVIGILDDYGLEKYVSVDLGMLRGLDYDTGIIFRGFTHGVGFPVLTGGRYDRLAGEFGKVCPATGFSLGVNLMMMALQRQKTDIEKPQTDSIVCYDEKGRKAAFELCDRLRRQGLTVELDIAGSGPEKAVGYAAAKNIGRVIRVVDGDTAKVYYVRSGESEAVKLSKLPKGG